MPGQPEPSSRDWGDRSALRKDEYDTTDGMRWLWRDHEVSTDPNDEVERTSDALVNP